MLEKPDYFILNLLQIYVKNKGKICLCKECSEGPVIGFILPNKDSSNIDSYIF